MFNLKLDESLFDDEIDSFFTKDQSSDFNEFDDDFAEYEEEHSVENVLPGPETGSDTGVASTIISLINDEWEAIEGYNSAIATLKQEASSNPFYLDAVKVLEEISSEENAHVGQLQEVLRRISPNAAEISNGTREAKAQLNFVGGVMPVQSWGADTRQENNENSAVVEDICTLTDVDDEL